MKKFFSRIWRGWKRIAHAIGVFQTKIILTIFYFLILGVVSIFIKIIRLDLLNRKIIRGQTQWIERKAEPVTIESCKRQF